MFFQAFNVNVLRNFESSQHSLNGSVWSPCVAFDMVNRTFVFQDEDDDKKDNIFNCS